MLLEIIKYNSKYIFQVKRAHDALGNMCTMGKTNNLIKTDLSSDRKTVVKVLDVNPIKTIGMVTGERNEPT